MINIKLKIYEIEAQSKSNEQILSVQNNNVIQEILWYP